MRTFLLITNVGELLKVCVQSTRDAPEGAFLTSYSTFPKESEFMTPIGICSVYNCGNSQIYATDKLIVETSLDEIMAETNFIFDPDNVEFRYSAYIIISFIVGYIIGNSAELYDAFVESYLEKIIFDNYDNSININAYNDFIKVEEELVGVVDHIPIQDVIFQKGMSTYLNKPSPLDIAAIDITNCNNMFKAKDIFYI